MRLLMIPNLFLIRAAGLENLTPDGQPVLFVFNHNNAFEALLVPVFLIYRRGGQLISFVIDWMYGYLPVIGWLMEMIDPVYVYHKRSTLSFIQALRPETAHENTVDRCCKKLHAGTSIGIFPEGTRNADAHQLMKPKPGIGHIALKSGVPVIPVGIDFPQRSAKGKIPLLGRIIVRIGAPMTFHEASTDYKTTLVESHCVSSVRKRRQELAGAVSHEIMLRLAVLSGKRCPWEDPAEKKEGHDNSKKKEQLCPV
ncbi:MAG: 1-acyl-sn-glycerol-3-phosphate acyltransferase [Chlorobiaceae bacterium]|nr:1-acyl-sn-glycerol-3-phosphate acyltransferase [Chlorobiaceae bacterium]NTW62934.1 1-acyl-sn-glycerol-3-phosphate acyltransferase [Chlorobiaceae bacterium]